MITTEIAFQWLGAAYFIFPLVVGYTFPTFYEDEVRLKMRKNKKKASAGESAPETAIFKDMPYTLPMWVFTPVWWVVCMATAAVFILYWQNPSVAHPDRADTVFALLYAVPWLELLWSYLFFRPYSWVGATIVSWILLAVFALVWTFTVWSGITTVAIMILLVIPSLWLIIASVISIIWNNQVEIGPITRGVELRHYKLNLLLANAEKLLALVNALPPDLQQQFATLRQRAFTPSSSHHVAV